MTSLVKLLFLSFFQNNECTCDGAMFQLITAQFKQIQVLQHTVLNASVYNIVC